MAMVEGIVKNSEYAQLAYRTISGRGLRVIVKVDGEVTKDNFKDAWMSANEQIKKICSIEYDKQCGNVNRLCGLAFDPQAVYRPLSKAVKIKTFKEPKKKAGRKPSCSKAGKTARNLVEGEGVEYVEGSRNQYVSRVIYWMNRFGVNADKTLKWAEKEFEDYDIANGHPIAGIVRPCTTSIPTSTTPAVPPPLPPTATRALANPPSWRWRRISPPATPSAETSFPKTWKTAI